MQVMIKSMHKVIVPDPMTAFCDIILKYTCEFVGNYWFFNVQFSTVNMSTSLDVFWHVQFSSVFQKKTILIFVLVQMLEDKIVLLFR